MASLISSIFSLTNASKAFRRLTKTSEKTKIGDLVIDVDLAEVIQFSSEVTKHPVETKTNIADHIFKQPLKIEISGMITDTPMRVYGIFNSDIMSNTFSSIKSNISSLISNEERLSLQAYRKLHEIWNNKSLVTVVSNYDAHDNMCITDLAITSSSDTMGGLAFTATLEEVLIVDKQTTTYTNFINKKITNLGIVQTKTLTDTRSYITKAFDSISSRF